MSLAQSQLDRKLMGAWTAEEEETKETKLLEKTIHTTKRPELVIYQFIHVITTC